MSTSTEPSVVFVRGCARSGTTLLADILNENPAIGILVEQPLGDVANRLLDLFWFDDHRKWQAQTIAAKAAGETAKSNRHFTPIDNTSRVRFPLRYPTRERFAKILTGVVENSLQKQPLALIGSKTPGHWSDHELQIVAGLYESIKFVFVVRNPIDTVNSIVNRRNAARDGRDLWPDKPISEAIARYQESACLLLSCASDYPETTFVVGYEDLIAEPSATLERLGRFLDAGVGDTSGLIKRGRETNSILLPYEREALTTAFGAAGDAWSGKRLTGMASAVAPQLHDCVRTVEVGKHYRCDAPVGDRGLLGSGWSGAEPPGIWSDSNASDIWFAVPKDGSYAMSFSFKAHHAYWRDPLRFTVDFAGRSTTHTARAGGQRRVRIGPVALQRGTAYRVRISFENLPAFSTNERVKDPRRKGICLRRFWIND